MLAEVRKRDGFDPHRLERMVQAGANRVLLPLADLPRDATLGVLDEYVAMIEAYR